MTGILEACSKCHKVNTKLKEEIFDEIKSFLKDPNNFHVRINPTTKFYKFERIK